MSIAERFSIAEIAARTGVTLRALRYYEAIGILQPKLTGRTRVYSADDIAKIKLVLKGKRFGLSLKQIKSLARFGESSALTELPLSKAQIDAQIDMLSRRRNDLTLAISTLKQRLEV